MSAPSRHLKSAELAFRRFLLRALSWFGTRNRSFPHDFDFRYAKILMARHDRIGDVLVLTPVIAALKRHYPDCIIDLLLSEKNHFVVETNPYIRKRWVYRKKPANALALLRAIRAEQYDFLIDPIDNPSVTSTILSMTCGARWRIGLSKENEFAYDIAVPLLSRKETHIVDRLAELLRVFNIDPALEPLAIEYFPSPESAAFARDTFHSLKLNGHTVVGINISAGDDTRFWGVKNFRTLLHTMGERFPDDRILLLFKPEDTERAALIADGFPHAMLAPITNSFDQFAALIQNVNALITPDTSAVHLAAAFRIPSVVLYVQSNKALAVWHPYRTPCEALIADVDDLSVIEPDAVFQAWARLRSAHVEKTIPLPTQ